MKVVDGKAVVPEKPETNIDKTTDRTPESDAKDFENLLDYEEAEKGESIDKLVKNNQTTTRNDTKQDSKSTDPPRIVNLPERLVVKRKWAILAENDKSEKYLETKRTKCLESLKDLKSWVNTNVMEFEDGKLFETLLCSDKLFNDPGIDTIPDGEEFRRLISNPANGTRKSNSIDIGLKAFVRTVIFDIFKDMAQGLALRNFEQKFRNETTLARRLIGKFLDEIIKNAERREDSQGEEYLELDRYKAERIKEDVASFFTDNRANTYDLNIYCRDIKFYSDKWLLKLLNHSAFCWENVSMMRYIKLKVTPAVYYRVFDNTQRAEYLEADVRINRIFRNPNVAPAGPVSVVFLSLFNTGWVWNELYQRVEATEKWSEMNRMSEIRVPVSVDKMLQFLIDPIK